MFTFMYGADIKSYSIKNLFWMDAGYMKKTLYIVFSSNVIIIIKLSWVRPTDETRRRSRGSNRQPCNWWTNLLYIQMCQWNVYSSAATKKNAVDAQVLTIRSLWVLAAGTPRNRAHGKLKMWVLLSDALNAPPSPALHASRLRWWATFSGSLQAWIHTWPCHAKGEDKHPVVELEFI